MIIFWIFTLLAALSTFAFAFAVLGVGWWAVLYGVAAIVILRGIFSWIRRWLILSERLPDTPDAEERTLETNRYLFWRRAILLMVVGGLYFGIANQFGLAPGDALAALPALVLQALTALIQIMFLLVANFALFFGPFLLFSRMGRETVEPGDANYEVRIEDVRGQTAAVEEMRRILKLMESGRNYVRAGGKRERGVLMVGPPGTGKTMLAKGIASSLRVPIIVSSGAAFQGMFMGMDMVAVYTTVRAAKKKAKRWGGCIIFIDEFDALGQRRSGMGGGGMMGGMMGGGGQLGLNMLLVQMDGVDNPTFFKKLFRRMVNVTLDGLFVPREIRVNGSHLRLRIPQLKAPRYNLFFLGATNRPNVLDEAVTRPGRFGRTITFRMPTRESRKDIADLYFAKKAHDPELDTPARRDEFSRVTEGYSPAMIEQATSLALMYAFEDGRDRFAWKDLREAMVNVEAGLAEPVEYTQRELLATSRHELGHAVAARYFMPDYASVRLSVRMRGGALGHHKSSAKEEEFSHFRSHFAGLLRHTLGAIAAERVFYGENSNGVTGDLMQATNLATRMVGVWAMGPDPLDPLKSRLAINLGEHLISLAEVTTGMLEGGNITGAVLGNRASRRMVAQIMGAAYIDCWRLMYANREGIDLAAEALMVQGELVGDEIAGLLDSVGLREVIDIDPYPDEVRPLPTVEDQPQQAAQSA